jgi:hypothetical protein
MPLTYAELLKHFPDRPASFYARNASDYRAAITGNGGSSAIVDTGKNPVVERRSRDGALGKRQSQKRDTGTFLVRVTAFRVRLLDEDNLCEKYHVDCCRYAGLLPSDAAGKAKITTSQEKVGSEAEERVEIVIYRIGVHEQQLLLDESRTAK